MTGTRLLHYDVLDKIGEGGMGSVYRARDRRLDRLVAIKFLPRDADLDLQRRFLAEARTASALNHPAIITIYDVGELTQDHAAFIAMELVPGETLQSALERDRMTVQESVRIAIQIADALDAAHGAGVVHRDLKPANIMLSGTRVKVLDFGLARRSFDDMNDVTRTAPGTVMGTAAYMSPEQIEGKDADQRSDIFSLGLVIYEMLTGRRAFVRPSAIATMAAILHECPDPWEADHTLREVVERCLARRPEDRFARMADLKSALESYPSPAPSSSISAISSSRWRAKAATSKEARIAVLPFADMSPQKDQEYFCDGIAEEILGALAQLPCVFVASRTSSFRFKGSTEDIRSIGASLNVDAVLEGSVRKAGDRLRITAQLVNIADGYRVWSERWDRRLEDIFDVQDEIAHAVVSALQVQFLAGPACPIVRRPTNDPEAYSLYLRGRHAWNTWSLEGLERAIDYFEQALARDPNYAEAWACLADVYTVLGGFGHRAPNESMPKAVEAARKALSLDDSLAGAHCSLAIALIFSAWNWSEAEAHLRRALEIAPRSGQVLHAWAACWLAPHGLLKDAKEQIDLALSLDSFSLSMTLSACAIETFSGNVDAALRRAEEARVIDPGNYAPHFYAHAPYLVRGDWDGALREIEEAARLFPYDTRLPAVMGFCHGMAGRTGRALECLAQLDELAKTRYVQAINKAIVLLGLNRVDEAIPYVEKAIGDHDGWCVYLGVETKFSRLRSHPRYAGLISRMGLG